MKRIFMMQLDPNKNDFVVSDGGRFDLGKGQWRGTYFMDSECSYKMVEALYRIQV